MFTEIQFHNVVSAILSNPNGKQPYNKIRIFKNADEKKSFFCEFFTKTQSFHKTLNAHECEILLKESCATAFKNTLIVTDSETITVLSNKKGKSTILRKPLEESQSKIKDSRDKKKAYILQEGIPIPFLIHLGIMTETGKIVASKYDKFKQINRFLEFIDDILPKGNFENKSYRVLDFGCGKSYLTFALYYFLVTIRKRKAHIVGIDLKEDVIRNCSTLAKTWGYEGLEFRVGRIEDYYENNPPNLDLMITLHACDTATDFALNYAIKNNAKAILSVPCCQHEINAKIAKGVPDPAFNSLMKYGIVKERFSALATDVMRAELLESQGYSVQLMEFVDMAHTAKNLLIRAIKRKSETQKTISDDYTTLCKALCVENTLAKLLK